MQALSHRNLPLGKGNDKYTWSYLPLRPLMRLLLRLQLLLRRIRCWMTRLERSQREKMPQLLTIRGQKKLKLLLLELRHRSVRDVSIEELSNAHLQTYAFRLRHRHELELGLELGFRRDLHDCRYCRDCCIYCLGNCDLIMLGFSDRNLKKVSYKLQRSSLSSTYCSGLNLCLDLSGYLLFRHFLLRNHR